MIRRTANPIFSPRWTRPLAAVVALALAGLAMPAAAAGMQCADGTPCTPQMACQQPRKQCASSALVPGCKCASPAAMACCAMCHAAAALHVAAVKFQPEARMLGGCLCVVSAPHGSQPAWLNVARSLTASAVLHAALPERTFASLAPLTVRSPARPRAPPGTRSSPKAAASPRAPPVLHGS